MADLAILPTTLSVRIDHPRQRAFLSAYIAGCGNVKMACMATGIAPREHYDWARHEPYRSAFREADRLAAETLEQEAIRRAVHGVRRLKFNPKTGEPYIDPVTGEPYIEHVYSDKLLELVLRAKMPERYGDVAMAPQVNIETSGPTQIVTGAGGESGLAKLRQKLLADLTGQKPITPSNGTPADVTIVPPQGGPGQPESNGGGNGHPRD